MKYRFKTPPYRHQVRALKRVLLTAPEGRAALFMEMRTGKSKVALDTAGALALKGKVKRVLIFCPYSSMGVWRREIRKHVPDELDVEWQVINYENSYARAVFVEESEDGENVQRGWIPVDNEELLEFNPDMLIVDESHMVGSINSVTHRKVYKIAKSTPYRLLLTGTPGKPEKIFAQFRILDESIFGNSMQAFQREYCKMGGYMSKQVKGYRNEERFREKIAPFVFQCREEDAWEVPKQQDEVVPVTLDDSRELYETMLDDAVVKVGSETVTAQIVLTQILRLSQITSGHLPTAGKPKRVGREKEKTYRGLVRQLLDNGHEKLVTFARFRPDIALCARAAMAEGMDIFLLHGSVPAAVRDQRIADFDEWVNPAMFISQIATGSMSVDLAAASDVIYYSLDRSLVHYQQSRARVRGKRQSRRITYWHLLAEGTVDELAYLALRKEQDLIDLILRHPQLLRRST